MSDIFSETEIDKFVEQKVQQVIDYFLGKSRLSLVTYVNGWVRSMKFNYGINLVVETVVEPNPDEIIMHIRAYIPPNEIENIRKTVRESVAKGLIDTKTRIKILGDIVRWKLMPSTGEMDALLQALHKYSSKVAGEAGGDREEGYNEEGGSDSKGDSEGS